MGFQYDRSPNDPKAAINYGKNFNFFNKLTVSNATFNTECDIVIPFSTYVVTFNMEGATGNQVQYSFNSNSIDGDMTFGQASVNLIFENRVISKIWFKSTGTGTAPVIRIEAWSIR